MPVKKTTKPARRPAAGKEKRKAAARPKPQPLVAGKPKKYPVRLAVWGLLLFIFIAWLVVFIVRVNNPGSVPGTPVYSEQAAVDPACNGDPMVTVPDCAKLKNQ